MAEQDTTISDSHRSVPAPFLTKTYQLVNDTSTDDVVSWGIDSSTFVVWKPMEFARDLLPLFFKHNNFSSFVRQLNTYGFRKIVPDRWEFYNENFRKGAQSLLCEIHRRKATAILPSTFVAPVPLSTAGARDDRSESSSPASSGEAVIANSPPQSPSRLGRSVSFDSLTEENERLKCENGVLASELARFRHMYMDVVVMMQHQQACFAMDSPSVRWNLSPWHRPFELTPVPLLSKPNATIPAQGMLGNLSTTLISTESEEMRETALTEAVSHMKQHGGHCRSSMPVGTVSGFHPLPLKGGLAPVGIVKPIPISFNRVPRTESIRDVAADSSPRAMKLSRVPVNGEKQGTSEEANGSRVVELEPPVGGNLTTKRMCEQEVEGKLKLRRLGNVEKVAAAIVLPNARYNKKIMTKTE